MAEKDIAPSLREAYAMIRRLLLSRNTVAVREVARRYQLSKADLESILRDILEEQKRVGTQDRLGPTYDIRTGRYLTLEEQVAQLLKG